MVPSSPVPRHDDPLAGPPLSWLLRASVPSQCPAAVPAKVARALPASAPAAPGGPRLVVARRIEPCAWVEGPDAVIEIFWPRIRDRLWEGRTRLFVRFALARTDACLRAGRPAPVCFRPAGDPGLLVLVARPPAGAVLQAQPRARA